MRLFNTLAVIFDDIVSLLLMTFSLLKKFIIKKWKILNFKCLLYQAFKDEIRDLSKKHVFVLSLFNGVILCKL
jgi:hypothetical protein